MAPQLTPTYAVNTNNPVVITLLKTLKNKNKDEDLVSKHVKCSATRYRDPAHRVSIAQTYSM